MKTITGNTEMNILLKAINEKLESTTEYKRASPTVLEDKVKYNFIEMLILKPLIFYVPLGTLSTNNSHGDFKEFCDDIFYIEDIFDLIFIANFSSMKLEKYTV